MEKRICQNCKSEFIIDNSDFAFYEKMAVPPPTFCPACRMQRRLAFRNERTLYQRKCDLCKKDIVSIFHSKNPYTVYCQPCWWSDKWDGTTYGREYDFSRPFFEQFQELLREVPLPSLFTTYHSLVNSEYVNQAGYMKNCYLLFDSDYDENCAYGTEVESSKECFDNLMINRSEFCYENVNCQQCYQTFYSIDCEQCHSVWFSKNLVGCSNCFGCVNLRKKQYHIFNKPYSKEEYFKQLASFNLGSFKNIEEQSRKAGEFFLKFPNKYMHGRFNSNVSGDYIYHSSNVWDSYIVTESQSCKYCLWLLVKPVKDCYDYHEWGDNAQRVYESTNCGEGISDIKFSFFSIKNCFNATYSGYYITSKNIFGCASLHNKSYCILNKQYSKEEYEALVQKITKQMDEMPYHDKKGRIYRYGEFFPIELSPFGYNETSAQEHFPLSAEAAAKAGYNWKVQEAYQRATTLIHDQLPDHIRDVPDAIKNEIIQCAHSALKTKNEKLKTQCNEQCTTAFRVIPQELAFYRKMNLPLPRLCPNCRHYQRLKKRNPFKLWHRKCQCAGQRSENTIYSNTASHFHGEKRCPNEFETSYSLERSEIVYCEQCYLQEVA